jgi:hypothetical protein
VDIKGKMSVGLGCIQLFHYMDPWGGGGAVVNTVRILRVQYMEGGTALISR